MNKTKIISLIMLLIMLVGTVSFASNDSQLKVIKNEEVVPIENVSSYKNSINNELVSDGVNYKLKNIEEVENKKQLTKDKEVTQDLIVTTNNKYDVLNLFEDKKNIEEDGYVGTLDLQNDSLDLKVNSSYREQYKVYLQKEYIGISRNELNNVPKQIEQDGTTYYLINPVWNVASTERIGGNDVPVTYNGIMNYEGIKERTIVKNYKATVKYTGTLKKEIVESITFKMEYEEIERKEVEYAIPIAITTGTIIIFSGIIIFKRKNVKIYNYDLNNNCKLIKKVYLNKKMPEIDITPLILKSNKFRIKLSEKLYKDIKNTSIKIKYFDKQYIYLINEKEFDFNV